MSGTLLYQVILLLYGFNINRSSLRPVYFSMFITIFLIITWLITVDNATSFFTINPNTGYSSAQNNDTIDITVQQTPINSSLNRTNSGLYGSSCVYYDSSIRTIHLCGGSTSLSTIDRMINRSDALNNTSDKNWVLNANISIANGATLYINSTDTQWLGINSTVKYPHTIVVYGNLIIDATKISSWKDTDNLKVVSADKVNGSTPRSYLLMHQQGTGHMNITNSSISDLGFNGLGETWGITYHSGSGSIIKNNNISSNFRGLHLSAKASNILVVNNNIQNSSQHGLSLYKTGNAKILDNRISNSGEQGIFCIRECENILIKSNHILKNDRNGILLSEGTSNSTVKNNMLNGNNRSGITIRNSSNNLINDNLVPRNLIGATVTQNSSYNNISDNSIGDSISNGILIDNNSTFNSVEENVIDKSGGSGIYIKNASDNILPGNNISENSGSGVVLLNSTRNVLNTNNVSDNAPYNYYFRPNSTYNIIKDTIFEDATLRFFDDSSNIILENTDNRIAYNDKRFPVRAYESNTTLLLEPVDNNVLVDTLDMFVFPSAGDVYISSISTDFDTNQNYKKWSEKSSLLPSTVRYENPTTKYVIGGFPPVTQIMILANKSFWNSFTSNNSGYITFDYSRIGGPGEGRLQYVVTEFEAEVNNLPTKTAIAFFSILIVGSIAFILIRRYLRKKKQK